MQEKTIVVKVGTSTLTQGSSRLNRPHMLEIVRALHMLHKQGHRVVLVSSGAIAAGREILGNPPLPALTSVKQMFAAVGQGRLIGIYEDFFSNYGIHIGQILLTRADVEDLGRFLNARDALSALLDNGIVPIINENDALSTQEIRVGDNDNIAALTGILCDADLVILLTDQKGLYTADPRVDKKAELIREVSEITPELEEIAGGSGTPLGRGGMATKLQAAKTATASGIDLVIASGDNPADIVALAEGRGEGTYFRAQNRAYYAKRTWLSVAARSQGSVVADDGAVEAMCKKSSNLLPKGIAAICGEFLRGAIISITDQRGNVIALGISRYSSKDLDVIRGHDSSEFERLLGFSYGPSAVHRNDFVLL